MEVEQLSNIAETQPHAAYAALTHGLSSKWLFLLCNTANISNLLLPLESILRTCALPTLTGHSPPCDLDREIFSLPARWGGLGICDPSIQSESEFLNSRRVCGPIVENLKNRNFTYDYNCECAKVSIKGEIQKGQWKKVKTQFGDLSN